MYYWIKFWGLCRPLSNLESIVIKPELGPFALVLEVIILLKDDILHRFASILQAFLQFILQNLSVKVCIHLALNPAWIFNSIPLYTAPQPHIIKFPSPNLTIPCTSLSESPSSAFFHDHILLSDSKQLILVLSDHTTHFQSFRVQCWCARAKSILNTIL